MHRSSPKFLREEFASCVSLIVQPSYNKCRSSYRIGVLVADCSNSRTYCTHNLLEPGSVKHSSNIQVYRDKSRDDDWLAASPDGLVDRFVYDLPSGGVLEIKCPFFNGELTRASPWKRIPLYYIPQAQGLMEILDRDWMDFYVWTPNGSSLFRVYRDLEYWDVMKMALSDFWWKHVQPAREMCSKYVISDPLKQLKPLKPTPRHELWSYLVYDSKRIIDNSSLLDISQPSQAEIREIHTNLGDMTGQDKVEKKWKCNAYIYKDDSQLKDIQLLTAVAAANTF
ncbi:hypothetical protein CUMW_072680 [Citrus unshiu]|nr:hypothetical protein CUMW_072680 [Citrus unshiu]